MDNFLIKYLFSLLLLTSCTFSQQSTSNDRPISPIEGRFTIEQQQEPDSSIQSINLHPENASDQPPVLSLKNDRRLLLSFDQLSTQSRQFRITFSHRSKDWEPSPLSPNFFIDGFSKSTIIDSEQSISQRPSYRHYEYRFPSEEFSFEASGNYLLTVSEYSSNKVLFTLPFFVSEEKGNLSTEVETHYANRSDLRRRHRLVVTYNYPDFVEMPRYDLSVYFAPNQFWGQGRQVGNLSTSDPGSIYVRQNDGEAFLADFSFISLDLSDLDTDQTQILELDESLDPPKVLLRRDVLPLERGVKRDMKLKTDRNSRYANVNFRLDTDEQLSDTAHIYVIGSFNQWMITERQKMSYNRQEHLWEGQALLKQGRHTYKYIMVENNSIKELVGDRGFRQIPQEYTGFIYYRDPTRNYDRLLQTSHQTVR